MLFVSNDSSKMHKFSNKLLPIHVLMGILQQINEEIAVKAEGLEDMLSTVYMQQQKISHLEENLNSIKLRNEEKRKIVDRQNKEIKRLRGTNEGIGDQM